MGSSAVGKNGDGAATGQASLPCSSAAPWDKPQTGKPGELRSADVQVEELQEDGWVLKTHEVPKGLGFLG